MDIKGGVMEYNKAWGGGNSPRYKGGCVPKGRKVKFLGVGGLDCDEEYGNKYLSVGGIYTVDEIYVGGWCSQVELKEYPKKKFNTVMFEDVEEVEK